MGNISTYSKKSWQWLNNGHPLTPFVIILLVATPLSYAAGNIALMLLAACSLYYFFRHRFIQKDWSLLLPVSLFVLMALSIVWSIDVPRSLKALPREIFLIALPVCFALAPPFTQSQKVFVFQRYAYGMSLIGVWYLAKALFRYLSGEGANVFFYHELVREEVNAIHVSIYVAVAFFALVPKSAKTVLDWFFIFILGLLLILLSSKNVIVVFGSLLVIYLLFRSGLSFRRRIAAITGLCLAVILPILLFPNIAYRFRQEFTSAFTSDTKNEQQPGVYNVSIREAWTQTHFDQHDYFPGTAFRVYQFRLFCEFLQEEHIFWTGFGLNASYAKIGEKAAEYNLFKGDELRKGYQGKNFHNQYVQNFAELGVFGFLLLIAMLIVSLRNAVLSKDFTQISFTVLMISLFLTESFLWRQRGVMFFTAMYCLTNSGMAWISTKNDKL